MLGNSQLARKSTESIERLYITMRHLFYRGSYKITGTSGLALRELLLQLNPEIYGFIANPHKVELQGLLYVLDRLPEGIEQTPYINLTADEGYDLSHFQPIVPLKRRRNCYRIDSEQMNIEVLRGRSEIYDVLTHLTFFYNEADKIMMRAFENNTKKMSRVWEKIENVVNSKKPLTQEEREVALIHLAHILGNTFEETKLAHEAFSFDQNSDRLFHVVYWMGKLSHLDHNGIVSREITFTSALRSEIGHHVTGEKWANHIKETLLKKNLHERPLHIISSNMHSVMNMLYAHNSLEKEFDETVELSVYEDLSSSKNKDLRDIVRQYAENNAMVYIEDVSGANIDVQIIDLKDFNLDNTVFSRTEWNKEDVLIVMDYAFGEQAFEVMDELCLLYTSDAADE